MRNLTVIGASQIFQSSGPCSLLELYHQRPSKQYSAYNAWNLDNNGNLNNNNKYNDLTVVPLAELSEKAEEVKGGYIVPLADLYDAFYVCRKNKRSTLSEMNFELRMEENVIRLWKEINDRSYKIGKSISFIVEQPVKREVFAANFRDRVVHDWICLRLIPLFEEYLPECMTSNRKNKGNLYAMNLVEELMRQKSEDYTLDCWIWKFDLQGFFMSIDKTLLNNKLQAFIDERYKGEDIEVLKWLTEKVIKNCPQNNCFRKSPISAWEGLKANKSLFAQDSNHGMPIGNLPSQLFANFLLSDMVYYLKERGLDCVQYVDDVVVVHKDKEEILQVIPAFRQWLKENLNITLHPRKCYIQHYAKGVSFVGGIIKPHRRYLSRRCRRKALAKIHWISKGNLSLEKVRESANSYLGITQHFTAYKLRKEIAEMLFSRFGHQISFGTNFSKMIIN